MSKNICLGTIFNDYIVEKSKNDAFFVAEKDYIEDIYQLAELCNRDISTFSFESKKDIYKVLWMIDLNKRESILKAFLENYYFVKYDLKNDFDIFLTKEIMIVPFKNEVKKLLKTNKLSEIANSFLNLNSLTKSAYDKLNNWINLENALINLNMSRPSTKLGKEYKNEFYLDIFENNIQRSIDLDDLKSLITKYNLTKQVDKILNETLKEYKEIK